MIEQHDIGFKGEDMSCFVRDSLVTSLKKLYGPQMVFIDIIFSL